MQGESKNIVSPTSVVILRQGDPLVIIQLIPFYEPNEFMTSPRSDSLRAGWGLEPGPGLLV